MECKVSIQELDPLGLPNNNNNNNYTDLQLNLKFTMETTKNRMINFLFLTISNLQNEHELAAYKMKFHKLMHIPLLFRNFKKNST